MRPRDVTRAIAASPDATAVAFTGDRSADPDTWVLTSDDLGAPQLLTTNPGFDVQPSWSPDAP